MCCEACPKYDDCAASDTLKAKCCQKCPDYNSCFEKGKDEYLDDYNEGNGDHEE